MYGNRLVVPSDPRYFPKPFRRLPGNVRRLTTALALAILAGSARAATLSAGNEAELIQAIDDANANVGADTIDLTADIMLTAALPTITDALTLAGAAGQRAILRDDSGTHACSPAATNAFRLLDASANLTLMDLRLQGGCNLVDQGGALRMQGAALHVERSLITGNQTVVENPEYLYGQGIGGGIAVLYGSATLIDSTISGNSTHGNKPGGGGIAVYQGDLDLVHSTISGNVTNGFLPGGAGAYAIGDYYGALPGTVTITNCTFTDNHADGDYAYGGGLGAFAEEVTITDSQFLHNAVTTGPHARGAGINIQNPHMSTVNRIERTIVAYNTITSSYGGWGAGIHHVGGVFSLVDSAVFNNTITADSKAVGGGIMIAIAVADVTNSTVSENEANAPNTPDVGGGGGGGIMILGEGADFTLLALFNSTISGNRAPTVTSGGIRVRSDPAGSAAPIVLIESTIVAGNEGISGLNEIGVEPDTPAKIIASHSLIQGAIDIGEGTFTADTVTLALRGLDPQLEPLAYDGGSTPAHALPATSPAIDQGSNTQALPFDQRGAPWARAVGVAPDIGAYELDTDRIFAGAFD